MNMRPAGEGRDDELFRSLYERYYPRMRRYFRQAFRVSEADAQELTQDSFLRVYRSLGEYRRESEWTFLETIARNVGYNRARSISTFKRGAVQPESLDDLDPSHNDPAAVQQDPVDRLIGEERVTRLRDAVAALPKGQRQCLQLWLEDMSYDEISKALQISLDAVRSRVRDAKRLLRERLGAEGVLPED
jgi:RNA polymerase sigma-70 factor, ECF subfamily